MAFSIPHTINGQPLAARNTIILIAALVIIISITVGALAFPRILPAKKKSYRQSEFHYQLNKTVHYAIDQLANEPGGVAEKAVVLNVLSSQSTLTFKTNQARFQRIYDRAHEVELAAITKLSEEGKVTDKIARLYVGLISRELASHGDGLINFCRGDLLPDQVAPGPPPGFAHNPGPNRLLQARGRPDPATGRPRL